MKSTPCRVLNFLINKFGGIPEISTDFESFPEDYRAFFDETPQVAKSITDALHGSTKTFYRPTPERLCKFWGRVVHGLTVELFKLDFTEFKNHVLENNEVVHLSFCIKKEEHNLNHSNAIREKWGGKLYLGYRRAFEDSGRYVVEALWCHEHHEKMMFDYYFKVEGKDRLFHSHGYVNVVGECVYFLGIDSKNPDENLRIRSLEIKGEPVNSETNRFRIGVLQSAKPSSCGDFGEPAAARVVFERKDDYDTKPSLAAIDQIVGFKKDFSHHSKGALIQKYCSNQLNDNEFVLSVNTHNFNNELR